MFRDWEFSGSASSICLLLCTATEHNRTAAAHQARTVCVATWCAGYWLIVMSWQALCRGMFLELNSGMDMPLQWAVWPVLHICRSRIASARYVALCCACSLSVADKHFGSIIELCVTVYEQRDKWRTCTGMTQRAKEGSCLRLLLLCLMHLVGTRLAATVTAPSFDYERRHPGEDDAGVWPVLTQHLLT